MAQVTKSKNFKEGQGIKGRNEPADVSSFLCLGSLGLMALQITAVAYVVAKAIGKPVEEVAKAAWENTARVFFPHRKDWM